jgi:CRISPR system Cascade subunit CasB
MHADTTQATPDFVETWKRYGDLPPGRQAELRRVADIEDLPLRPALYRLLPGTRPHEGWLRFVFLLPWCTHREGAPSFGAHLAEAGINEARLFQAVRADSPLDMIQLRRLAMQIEPTLDWQAFGRTLYYWGPRAKRQLVEDFYLAQLDSTKGARK